MSKDTMGRSPIVSNSFKAVQSPTSITEGIDIQGKSLEELEQAIVRLRDRLDPFLIPSSPVTGQPLVAKEITASDVGRKITGYIDKIQAIRDWITDLADRLDR